MLICWNSGIKGELQEGFSYAILTWILLNLSIVVLFFDYSQRSPYRNLNEAMQYTKGEVTTPEFIVIRLFTAITCFVYTVNPVWLVIPVALFGIVPVIDIKGFLHNRKERG